ncbi:MAG: T9SS type A sorting domain-containing protein [Bacteroidota bacterium]|nr:T9SS type A sorting domain-containing protein [Bacteroidota bacterium]
MKKLITLPVVLMFIFLTFKIQAQEFNWAKRAGMWGVDLGYGVCVDAMGNIYVTGKYEMNARFDDITVDIMGNHDIFNAKYGPDGKIIWVRTAGGLYGDYGHAIVCDAEGNTYLTGEMDGDIIFDGSDIKLSGWGRNDIFIAKYNTEGVALWAQRGGGAMSDKGDGIAISKDAVYATGYFRDVASFGNNGAYKVASKGEKEAYLVKYDLMGNLLWLKRGGGIGDDEGNDITVDAEGYIYLTGYFTDEADFDGVMVKSNGGRDAYLAKYAPSGDLIYVKNVGGSRGAMGNSIKAGKDGRVYMTGGFSGSADFGSTKLKSNGARDVFVACFTNEGEIVWANNAGGEIDDEGLGLALDDSSNVYITGYYGNSADFGAEVVTGVDSSEIFIAKYDSNGEFKWVMKADGQNDGKVARDLNEAGRAICVDPKNYVIVTGSFITDAVFGPFALNQWSNTNIFTAKIKQDESDDTPYVTNILKNNSDNYFKIYPIPSDKEINISYSGEELSNVKIRLESMEGKTLLEKQFRSFSSGNQILQLNDIAKGIYILQISTEQEHFFQKIIIK